MMDSFAAAPMPFKARAPMKEPSVFATAIQTWPEKGQLDVRPVRRNGRTSEAMHRAAQSSEAKRRPKTLQTGTIQKLE